MQVGCSVLMRPASSPKHDNSSKLRGTRSTQFLSFPQDNCPISIPPLLPETIQAFEQAKRRVAETAHQFLDAQYNVVIHTLGTASATPSKHRNGIVICKCFGTSIELKPVSSTLIRIPGWGNILLDAGEGTFGQIARYFGPETNAQLNLVAVLRDIRCIFISHIHADHMVGVARLLSKREKVHASTLTSCGWIRKLIHDHSSSYWTFRHPSPSTYYAITLFTAHSLIFPSSKT
jgi:hypothetical protein